ncbi:cytochrome P450 9e2-like, partial [Bombus fervidus]|uniref:cytochrome P450 9e2-like n=1 Tax=Bombus fervidus TaxID=203811 RepID=UPI003AB75168
VDYLYDHPEYTSSIDAKDAFTRFTNDVIASVFFGVSVNSMEDRNNEFSGKGKDVFASFICSIVKMLLMHFCLRIFNILGIMIIRVATSNLFRKVISKNLKEREERGIVRPDMLHLLIQARDKEKMTTYYMDIDVIVSQAFLSSSLVLIHLQILCYFLQEISLNSDIQEKLRNEIDRCLDFGIYECGNNHERFDEKNKDNIVPYTYMPFGAVFRKCITDHFVLMEVKILMVLILHKFLVI